MSPVSAKGRSRLIVPVTAIRSSATFFHVSLGYEATFFFWLSEIARRPHMGVRYACVSGATLYVSSVQVRCLDGIGTYVRGNLRLLPDRFEGPSDTITVAASSLELRCHGNIAHANRERYMIAKLVEQKK